MDLPLGSAPVPPFFKSTGETQTKFHFILCRRGAEEERRRGGEEEGRRGGEEERSRGEEERSSGGEEEVQALQLMSVSSQNCSHEHVEFVCLGINRIKISSP